MGLSIPVSLTNTALAYAADDDTSDSTETTYLLESDHNYANSEDVTYSYTLDTEDAAEYGLAVTFSSDTYVENGYDYLYIYDGDDNLLGTYTGSTLAGATIYVPQSNTVKVRLVSDSSVNYYGFAVTSIVALTSNDLELCGSIGTISAQYYTGKAVTPAPVVTYGSKTLNGGIDYSISYENNREVGTATVTVTGAGEYTGSLSTTFKIVDEDNLATGATITAGQQMSLRMSSDTGTTSVTITVEDEAWASAVTSVTVAEMAEDENLDAVYDEDGNLTFDEAVELTSDQYTIGSSSITFNRTGDDPIFDVDPGEGYSVDISGRWSSTTYPNCVTYQITIVATGYETVSETIEVYTGASDTFSIIIDEDGDDSTTDDQTVAYTWTTEELEALSEYGFQNASSQCGMTGFRTFSGMGVTLEDLLSIAGVEVYETDTYLLDTTDSWGTTKTYDDLFGSQRYFLSGIYTDEDVQAQAIELMNSDDDDATIELRKLLAEAALADPDNSEIDPMITTNYVETILYADDVDGAVLPTEDNTEFVEAVGNENQFRFLYGITIEQEECTVTFDTGEGSEVESQTVLSHYMTSTTNTTSQTTYWTNSLVIYRNSAEADDTESEAAEALTVPDDPTRDGYVFLGWYTDEDCTDGNEFDFTDNDGTVDSDTTLYAKWAYAIDSEEDLNAFAALVEAGDYDLNAVVTADFALTDGLLPMIANNDYYTGTFDGGGYTISGITAFDDDGRNYGFFNYISTGAVIKDLTLEGTIGETTTDWTGVFVVHGCGGTIQNCTNKVNVTSSSMVGGIISGVYIMSDSTVYVVDCTNEADITSTSSKAGGIFGGIMMCYEDPGISISGCTNNGTVTGTYAGGMVGHGMTGSMAISDCTNNGEISGTYAGGMIGYTNTNSARYLTIEDCVNNGSVAATAVASGEDEYVGGHAGGIGGSLGFATTLTGCFNYGAVSGDGYTGGIVGAFTASTAISEFSGNYYYYTTADAAVGGENVPESGAYPIYLESEHTYANSADDTQSFTLEGATYGLAVTFSEDTYTESGYDYIYIYDGDDNLLGTYDGDDLAGATVYVGGSDTVKVRLTSDSSYAYFGYIVTGIEALEGNDLSLAGSLDYSALQYLTAEGTAVELSDLVVSYGATELTLGQDYTVAYENNTTAGTATFTVTGTGSYSGTLSGEYTIISESAVTTVASHSVYAWRESSYGEPPDGEASTAGCHVTIELAFDGQVTVTDEEALIESLSVSCNATFSSGYVDVSVSDDGTTLVLDGTLSGALAAGTCVISAANADGLLDGVTVDGCEVQLDTISTLVDTGLVIDTVEVVEGTDSTVASTTFVVSDTANVRSMNHVIWLSSAGSTDGTGSAILANSGSYSQSTTAHHHAFYSFTAATSASMIVSNATSSLEAAGYTITDNGDGTFTVTAAEAVAGEVISAASYSDSFFNETGIAYGEDVTGVEMPEATGHTYGQPEWTWADDYSAATASFTCSVCGAVTEVEASVNVATSVAATCVEGGEVIYRAKATVDGTSYYDYVEGTTEATGVHSWDEGTVTQEATATEDGVITYTCTVCGETYTEAIPATGTTDDTGSGEEAASYSFTDVQDSSAYYYEAVYALAEAGYMTGTSDDVFGVGKTLNRQAMVTVLYRIFGDGSYGSTSDSSEYADNATPLTDVPDGKYYTAAVNWAYATGVATGYSTGEFGVGDDCSFQQFCTFLARAAGVDGELTSAEAQAVLAGFADGSKVASYAAPSVAYLCGLSYDDEGNTVVGGTAAGKLNPTSSVSRERTATVVYRCMAAGLFE